MGGLDLLEDARFASRSPVKPATRHERERGIETTTGWYEDEMELCSDEDRHRRRNRRCERVDRIASKRMRGHVLRVMEKGGECPKELVEVAMVLYNMVESFKNGLGLVVKRGHDAGMFVLIFNDAPLTGSNVTLHLSSL